MLSYKDFKKICYIPFYGLVEFYFPVFIRNFKFNDSIEEAEDWTKFGKRLHIVQSIYLLTSIILLNV